MTEGRDLSDVAKSIMHESMISHSLGQQNSEITHKAYHRALKIIEATLGRTHSDFADELQVMNDLTCEGSATETDLGLCKQRGEEILCIYQGNFDGNHPKVFESYDSLGKMTELMNMPTE